VHEEPHVHMFPFFFGVVSRKIGTSRERSTETLHVHVFLLV
jgi:hypothetical protein